MINKTLVFGTRGSKLAMWQAERAKELALSKNPELEIEIKIIKTEGDRIQDMALAKIGERGLFTKAIEDEILAGSIDVGVHSAKDMPTVLSKGLSIAAYPEREDCRDALISRNGEKLSGLKDEAVIGTSSLRRKAFLKRMRANLNFIDLRGNVDTRLKKLESGQMDAILMAYAAIKRMKIENRTSDIFNPEEFLPAVGQGALALEMREDDENWELISCIDDRKLRACVEAERSFLGTLQGGCQIPVGCLTALNGEKIRVKGGLANLKGEWYMETELEGEAKESATVGRQVAEKLLKAGANFILEEIRANL